MKVTSIGNAVRVSDIDLMDDGVCEDLGRVVAHECVAFVDASVPEARLRDIQMLWGQPYRAVVHRLIADGRLKGPHWRSLLVSLGRTARAVKDIAPQGGMSRVSFETDRRGKPVGLFANGELGWHCERPAIQDSQIVTGLMSLWGTEGSQTSFLCTAPAYEALNHDERSTVDELVTVWNWDGGTMARGLNAAQLEIGRFSMLPLPDMTSPLLEITATGRRGFRFPNHCLDHFEGMGREESVRYRDHLWNLITRREHVYTHDWKDGQIMFMDQNITLHARPTNVRDGDTRTLSRTVGYLDRLFPDQSPNTHIAYGGRQLDADMFAELADAHKRETVEIAD